MSFLTTTFLSCPHFTHNFALYTSFTEFVLLPTWSALTSVLEGDTSLEEGALFCWTRRTLGVWPPPLGGHRYWENMAAVPSAPPWSLSLREVGEVGRWRQLLPPPPAPLAEAAAAAAFPTSITVDSPVRRCNTNGFLQWSFLPKSHCFFLFFHVFERVQRVCIHCLCLGLVSKGQYSKVGPVKGHSVLKLLLYWKFGYLLTCCDVCCDVSLCFSIKDTLGPRRLPQIWKLWYVLNRLSMGVTLGP